MILTIDIGNSRVKWILFEGDRINKYGLFVYGTDSFRSELIQADFPADVELVAISNVAGSHLQSELVDVLKERGIKEIYIAETQSGALGVSNAYKECSKLGVDRWLAMLASFNAVKPDVGKSVCVIDCGTAVTLDVVNSAGVHQGGIIVPGYKMMCSALNDSTENIEEDISDKMDVSLGLGLTTRDAVRQGCAQIIMCGLAGLVKRLSAREKDGLLCFVTGGDGEWVNKMLEKDSIYDPHLVNKGLLLMAKDRIEKK